MYVLPMAWCGVLFNDCFGAHFVWSMPIKNVKINQHLAKM